MSWCTNENIPEVKFHNFSVGMPVPYMLFTKGLAENENECESRYDEFLYVYGSINTTKFQM
jgi:hypothetical protein